jgi:2,3-bisphosphoglycerate-dependent phosphoglycerate mutase
MTTILLVRHAESAPSADLPEADWPLSATGMQQAQHLVEALRPWPIGVVFSSPYRRAVATVEPYAQQAGLRVHLLADLRERKLAEGLRPDWAALLQRAWADFSFALPGGESGLACQRRMRDCLDGLAARYPTDTLLVASHGNAIALYLNSLDAFFGYAAWVAMRNPDVFRVVYAGGQAVWGGKKLDLPCG